MQVGVAFPTIDIGDDFAAVRDFVQVADELGYSHLRVLDHVLGADPQFHPEVPTFYYTHESYIHEPFTFMAYLAAITTKSGVDDRNHYPAAATDCVGGQTGRGGGRPERRATAAGYRRRVGIRWSTRP